jgi:hypothetical protein
MARAKELGVTKRTAKLVGMRPMMFDRYAGDNKTSLSPEQKLYLSPALEVTLPTANVMSFLGAQNTESAAKRFLGKRWRAAAAALTSFVTIDPDPLVFTRNGKAIKFEGFDAEPGGKLGSYIHRAVARLPKGIPNPKERPVIALPWEITLEITLLQNPEMDETGLLRLFEQGGAAIGFGTYRGIFGKFRVESWE